MFSVWGLTSLCFGLEINEMKLLKPTFEGGFPKAAC
jgi:hypothetical protein